MNRTSTLVFSFFIMLTGGIQALRAQDGAQGDVLVDACVNKDVKAFKKGLKQLRASTLSDEQKFAKLDELVAAIEASESVLDHADKKLAPKNSKLWFKGVSSYICAGAAALVALYIIFKAHNTAFDHEGFMGAMANKEFDWSNSRMNSSVFTKYTGSTLTDGLAFYGTSLAALILGIQGQRYISQVSDKESVSKALHQLNRELLNLIEQTRDKIVDITLPQPHFSMTVS